MKAKKHNGRAMVICLFLLLSILVAGGTTASAEKDPVFEVITVDAAITPPIAEFILERIQEAGENAYDGLIIRLDTPGGLDTSMREIAKGILNAPLPVVVYVHPAGARAASAGVIITLSAHVAAMTPGTNIGAAHPVGIGVGGQMDKTMAEKIENDAVAYVKGIAQKRGRNEEWAAQSVLKSESITAEEALKLGVIDIVAVDLQGLLTQMENRRVTLPGGERVLKTANAQIVEKEMGMRLRILSVISNPNVAYILLLAGLAGLYFEFANPGAILPGVIGGISLILAFFALQTLPVNYAGVLLILFAIVLFIAEIKVISHGLLTVGGIFSLIMGSLLLFDSPEPALRVSLQVLVPTVTILSLFFIAVISLAVKAQMGKKHTGQEGMKGAEGIAVSEITAQGKVLIKGEYWNATSERTIGKGSRIRVKSVEGLTLNVEEIN